MQTNLRRTGSARRQFAIGAAVFVTAPRRPVSFLFPNVGAAIGRPSVTLCERSESKASARRRSTSEKPPKAVLSES